MSGQPIGIDLPRLERYLGAELGLRGRPGVTRFTAGHSNPTYLLDYPDRQVVLRSQPAGPLLPRAHAVDREYAIQRSLEGSGLPVPRMLALCTDTGITGGIFYLMEYVPGRVLNDPWLPEADPEERTPIWFALADTLAALHAVEPDVAVFGGEQGRAGYLERQTARWTKNYRAADVEPSAAMDEVAQWLAAQRVPEPVHRISHGDFRLGNTVYAPDRPRVRAILDWELATTGDPCADLAYSCLPWYFSRASGRGFAEVDRAAESLPEMRQYVDRYVEAGGAADVERLGLFVVLSMFRTAAILAGIRRRALDGNASNEHAVEAGERYRSVAELARRIVEEM